MVSACSDAALVVSVGPGLDLRVGDNLDSRNDRPNKERSPGPGVEQSLLTGPASGLITRINREDPSSKENTNNSRLDDLQLIV